MLTSAAPWKCSVGAHRYTSSVRKRPAATLNDPLATRGTGTSRIMCRANPALQTSSDETTMQDCAKKCAIVDSSEIFCVSSISCLFVRNSKMKMNTKHDNEKCNCLLLAFFAEHVERRLPFSSTATGFEIVETRFGHIPACYL